MNVALPFQRQSPRPSGSAEGAGSHYEADCHFAIGKSHTVCEDYALSSPGDSLSAKPAFALLADGCSSAPNSDIGARLLCHAAAQSLDRAGAIFTPGLVMDRAAQMARSIGLPSASLDATLLCAQSRGDGSSLVDVSICGDGVLLAKRNDGVWRVWSYHYDDEAPAYLSYLLDVGRLECYLAGGRSRSVELTQPGGAVVTTRQSLLRHPFVVRHTLDSQEYPLIMLLSDGATSFRGAGGERVPLSGVLQRLAKLRSPRGRFVTRRCRRFLGREIAKLGWHHHDDLAVAALMRRTAT